MIKLKTPEEIKIMQEGGKITVAALQDVLKAIDVGVSLAELDAIAEKTILRLGAKPSFKMVDDYKYSTCINVNDGIVHGIPSLYKIKQGDLVSVDLGAFYKDFHTDLSYTVEVGTNKEDTFLNAGKEALKAGISNCKPENYLGMVSNSIQRMIEKWGYSVSRDLVGHGIGRDLHEDPYVPGYGKIKSYPVLKEGMVLALEVIYQKGKPHIVLDSDGWTLKTADGSLAGLFETTVAVTKDGPLVLTDFPML